MKTKRKDGSNRKHKGMKDESALETLARTIGATLGTVSARTTRISRASRKLTVASMIGSKKRSLKKPARRKMLRRATTPKRRRPGSKA